MTNTRIRARLLVAVMAIVACLALAPVTARAAQTSSWSATTIAAFGGGFDMAGPGGEGGDNPFGGGGMPGAPGEEAAPVEEEEAEPEDALEAFTNTIQSYVDYAVIHPVRVFGSMVALVLGLIFAFAYRKRA